MQIKSHIKATLTNEDGSFMIVTIKQYIGEKQALLTESEAVTALLTIADSISNNKK